MLIDNRLGDPKSPNADPPRFGPTKMQWILDQGWLPSATNGLNRTGNTAVPDEVPVDEGVDNTINQWYSVYRKKLSRGHVQPVPARQRRPKHVRRGCQAIPEPGTILLSLLRFL